MSEDGFTREQFWIKQKGEEDKKYAIKEVPAPDYLNGNEVKVLHHLSKAVDAVNPIYINQVNPEYRELSRFLSEIKEHVSSNATEKIEEYEKAMMVQNGPYAGSNDKSLILDVPEEEIEEAVSEADSEKVEEHYKVFRPVLMGEGSYTGKGNFYPEGLEEEKLEEIEGSEKINTRILKTEDGYEAVPNEEIYRDWIKSEIIPHLKNARDVSNDEKLVEYLNSKVKELESGTKEDRLEAHRKWLELGSERDGKIDLILGLSNETYNDDFKGIKGSAEALLLAKNESETERWKRVKDLLPRIEEINTYSSEYKKSKDDFDISSDLITYDVVRWSGDNVQAATLIGKSWPDEGDLGRKQMIFDNMCKLSFCEETFNRLLTQEDYREIKGHTENIGKLFVNLHEQGHSTGLDAEDRESEELGDLEDTLEEARANLVAVNSIPLLKEEEIIQEDEATAYKIMVGRQTARLMYAPTNDHVKSENLIVHFLEETGAIERSDGKFKINSNSVKGPVENLLRRVGNIKYGDKRKKAEELLDEFVYEDEWKDELSERMKDIPQGRGFMFPEFKEKGEIGAPSSFEEQDYLQIKI